MGKHKFEPRETCGYPSCGRGRNEYMHLKGEDPFDFRMQVPRDATPSEIWSKAAGLVSEVQTKLKPGQRISRIIVEVTL